MTANHFFDTVPSEQSLPSLQSILEIGDPLYVYSPDLSNLALQSMNLAKFNDLSRISEEPEAAAAAVNSKYTTITPSKYRNATAAAAVKSEVPTLAPPAAPLQQQYYVDTSAQLAPMMDKLSVVSEQVCHTNEKIPFSRVLINYVSTGFHVGRR